MWNFICVPYTEREKILLEKVERILNEKRGTALFIEEAYDKSTPEQSMFSKEYINRLNHYLEASKIDK